METMQENPHNVLNDILTEEELTQIPEGVSKKLKSYFDERFEEFLTAKAVCETAKQNLEQRLETLQKENEEYKLDLDECRGKLELANKYTNELQSKVEESRSEAAKAQELLRRYEKENAEFRHQRDIATDERDALQLQVERRDAELERAHTELTTLSAQLQAAVTAKCQALADTEEIRSREMTLDYKEKRLEKEQVLLSQQLANLEAELAKRISELQNLRAESSSKSLLIETQLVQRNEELRIANDEITKLQESKALISKRCEEIAQKLEDQRNHELSMHASYQEEVNAQTRLAEIYKRMADEVNAKAEEFSSAVKELQSLLEQATEQYGLLETQHNDLQVRLEEEVSQKSQIIEELTKELDRANDLLKEAKQERLDNAVEQLAPTAAVASRLLRKDLSLTQIYTQLVDATNELSIEKEENERLKSQMNVILRELEDKAPLLQQQREDYEAAVANVTTLTTRLDDLVTENHRLREATDEASCIANHHTRENKRLRTEMADLGRQVCFLLKEVQESRSGSTTLTSSMMESDDLASSQIISKKLVTFRDIEELQENNQRLLSIVRTLSAKQEEIEKATDEINSGEMKEKLGRYIEQLADMQAAQDRQSKMLEDLLRQRDMYKNMYQQCFNQSSNNRQEPVTDEEKVEMEEDQKENEGEKEKKEREETEKKISELETKLKQLRDEYDTYRKERSAHERMLTEEVERLRKEAGASSSRCCRLKAQLDSANERFHLLQANVSSYKTQIKVLEEKCSNYNTTIGKHEQSIMMLKDETLDAQARLSRAEVQLENLRQERQLLRDSEGRLLKEREVLHRERQTQALLRADVEAIKASLERSQAEGQLRAEQRLDDATSECAALRRRLQEEQDRFRELASHLERQATTAQQRLTEERELLEKTKAELEAARQVHIEDVRRLEEYSAKLRQADANSIAKPMTGDESTLKRLKELEVQVSSSQGEVRSLTEQLKAARLHGQQYCNIAESSETQLRELMIEHTKYKEDFEQQLKNAQVAISAIKKQNQDLQEEVARVKSGRQETDSELREKLNVAERQLEEFEELRKEVETTKSQLTVASNALKETEEKYAREMLLHSTDLQALARLKEESGSGAEKIANLSRERDNAIDTLQIEKSAWQEREKRLNDEVHELQVRMKDLDSQNALLHDQIQELSDRSAIMQSQQSNTSGHISPDTSLETMNRSFSGQEDDSKSAEQLLRVMKYLRREKDLAVAKFDVLRAENLRLKSQAEVLEKRLKEAEALLSSQREESEIDIVTTSKHSELLRKVETLNAITDSNRILREERDTLLVKVNELTTTVTALSDEVVPLREKVRELSAKTEALVQENSGLKGEATRWRQRANALVERANKASPEDWRRLQTERENLSKLLTSERETHAKRAEEFNALKLEKSKLEEQLIQQQKQLQSQSEQLSKTLEESRKLNQDLSESMVTSAAKLKEVTVLRKELTDKEAVLNDIKNKELKIRTIAKKYKTQFEELTKTLEEEKSKQDESRTAGTSGASEEVIQGRENQLREEGRQELRQANVELTSRVEELSRQLTALQSETEVLKKEAEASKKVTVEKQEHAKLLLKGARTKIMQLTESKKVCEQELTELKTRLESNSGDPDGSEHDARLAAIKSQMEGRISRLEHEKTEILAEKEALLQRVTQLQRQLSSGAGGVSVTTEPPTANIKPMSARSETPLASIRPMSVVVQSRTAAVLPTTAAAPVLVAPQQQQQQAVHTTETSSPTSSHTDYQPASTSSSSQTTASNLRQLAVQPQLSESAESTQREEPESAETLSIQQQQCQQPNQQQQQTVALVSPRVEQQPQQQQQLQQQVVVSVSDQQQTVASSSTQSVSTSQGTGGHKRPRSIDTSASGSGVVEGGPDATRQEQNPSPKTKRSRQQEVAPTPTASADVEYQVPTSSQRDQDEEVEEGCVVVVDCDEGEGGGTQAQEEEEFDNETYEEMEEEEESPYGVEAEGEVDNNEVEIIMEDDSTGVEVPRQVQPTTAINQQHQQQSEAISSAGPTGEPTLSFGQRSSRGIAPMPRQQQQQHLLLPQQGYEDGGDDSIVPSTPTLFVPRRDGFGEAVSSPQVPQGRFTFGEPSPTVTATATPTMATPTGPTRAIFGSSGSGVAQVVQEGMDDTRMDLTQLEDAGTGRSVPTTPLQVSPAAADIPPSTSSGQSEEQETPGSGTVSTAGAATSDGNDEAVIPSIRVVTVEEQEAAQVEVTTEALELTPADGGNAEGEKQDDAGPSTGDDDIVEVEVEAEAGSAEIGTDEVEDEGREAEASPSSNTRSQKALAAAASTRGVTARRSTRSPFRTARGTRPTPIIWENQSGRGHNPTRGGLQTRGGIGENRARGSRGRRMRKPFPYARF
ncbi:nucleoprotein TPR isoform X2 [Athalia rosae]|uniref:nucleoprotein TPR isoform X2 n=1 Tax=Athalia rosae TaxID=37344 RepID=UPI0020347493|nr:nucleoprotein TPR isoform X2 [Athalia rosae]